MRILVGIDDTDNLESRGTGFKSRQLGRLIENNNLGKVAGISRHQLFFDSRIPYTSKNSSACLDVYSDNKEDLIELSRTFLLVESADGSDAGLAVSEFSNADDKIVDWGVRAKKEVLTKDEAYSLAEEKKVFLEGLTGNKDGIIGSLAAIGLRKSGDDGRFLWLQGKEIRDLAGKYTVKQLFKEVEIDEITDKAGNIIPEDSLINLSDWVRPVLIKNKIIIIVEKYKSDSEHEWEVATKDYIKSFSD